MSDYSLSSPAVISPVASLTNKVHGAGSELSVRLDGNWCELLVDIGMWIPQETRPG